MASDNYPPACRRCAHYRNGSGGVCVGPQVKQTYNAVTGYLEGSSSAYFQRWWFWAWLGLNTCGKDGRYFEP